MNSTSHRYEVSIEADPTLPIVRITREFDATPAQLMRAHTDPELFVRWVGPDGMETKIVEWDATTGGRWRYVAARDGQEYGFHGSFHEVGEDRSSDERRGRRAPAHRGCVHHDGGGRRGGVVGPACARGGLGRP